MPDYGLYKKPFAFIGWGGGNLKGSNLGGGSAAATQANRGKGQNRIYHLVDAQNLHVATFGPFATTAAAVATNKTAFESMQAAILTAINA